MARQATSAGRGGVTEPEFAPIQRVALTREEAAASIGIGIDAFEEYVQPELRLIAVGRRRLVPVGELQRWAERAATRALEGAA